jgi:hypothetical protein
LPHRWISGANRYRKRLSTDLHGTATGQPVRLPNVLTAFGAAAVTFMMLMYALERRGRGFILAFGCGCLLSSAYGFAAGTWPFGVVELVWAGVAFNRYRKTPADEKAGSFARPT